VHFDRNESAENAPGFRTIEEHPMARSTTDAVWYRCLQPLFAPISLMAASVSAARCDYAIYHVGVALNPAKEGVIIALRMNTNSITANARPKHQSDRTWPEHHSIVVTQFPVQRIGPPPTSYTMSLPGCRAPLCRRPHGAHALPVAQDVHV
jgi:hypothetical protein